MAAEKDIMPTLGDLESSQIPLSNSVDILPGNLTDSVETAGAFPRETKLTAPSGRAQEYLVRGEGGLAVLSTAEEWPQESARAGQENICIRNVELHVTDNLDTKAWIFSEHCAHYFLTQYGVFVSFPKGTHAADDGKSDTVSAVISKSLDNTWSPLESQWFVDMAADALQSLATRGLCSRKIPYKGPLAQSLEDGHPTAGEVVEALWGIDERNRARIEQETGSILRAIHGLPPGPAAGLVIEIRSASMHLLLRAEASVQQLLDATAEQFEHGGRDAEALKLEADSSPQSRDSPAYIPLEDEPRQVESDSERDEEHRMDVLEASVLSMAGSGGFSHLQSTATRSDPAEATAAGNGGPVTEPQETNAQPEGEENEEKPALVDTDISSIPSTRTIHLSRHGGDLSASWTADTVWRLVSSIVEERLEVPPEFLAGSSSSSVIQGVDILDEHLAAVTMRHEQLAGALWELFTLEPSVVQGMHLALGPAEASRDPRPRDAAMAATAVRVSSWPARWTPDEVYRAIHRALRRSASAQEKKDGRRATQGRLLRHLELHLATREGLAVLATPALKQRLLQASEQTPTLLSGVQLAAWKQPEEALPQVTPTPEDDEAGSRKRRAEEYEVERQTVFVKRIPPDWMHEQRIANVFAIALRGRQRQQQKDGQKQPLPEPSVVEVRTRGSECALVQLDSIESAQVVLALFKSSPSLFAGVEILPYDDWKRANDRLEALRRLKRRAVPRKELDRNRCIYAFLDRGNLDEEILTKVVDQLLPRGGRSSFVTNVRVFDTGRQAFVELTSVAMVDQVLLEHRRNPDLYPGLRLKTGKLFT